MSVDVRPRVHPPEKQGAGRGRLGARRDAAQKDPSKLKIMSLQRAPGPESDAFLRERLWRRRGRAQHLGERAPGLVARGGDRRSYSGARM
jgi:hypothetical protein